MLQLRLLARSPHFWSVLYLSLLSRSARWNQSTITILTNAIYRINAVSLLTNTKIKQQINRSSQVIMDTTKVLLVMVVLVVSRVQGLMVMDEPSCQDVEEAECGVCHTLYMEECSMEMVPEMMPKKVSMCRNVTR